MQLSSRVWVETKLCDPSATAYSTVLQLCDDLSESNYLLVCTEIT